MRIISSVTIILLLCSSVLADSYPRNPNIDIIHYKFHLELNDATDEIQGKATITVRFRKQGVFEFGLDLVSIPYPDSSKGMSVTAVAQNGKRIAFKHVEDKIHIKMASPSKIGEVRSYLISYHGIPADGLIISKNKFGDRTFFGDNWPNRAHHWLPTLDHPYDKATCEFIVDAPAHYQVVANGLLQEISDLPNQRIRTHWRTAIPMPTKVMVIGVAEFAVDTAGVYHGKQIQSWVYTQDREPGFYDFAQAVRVLEFFDKHVGPFPYSKLANVQSKTKYGGMENASAIFYNEKRITGKRDNEGLIAHEIAHQWFGDSVTEADWHHVWLSESFATYFAWVFDEFTYGRERLLADLQGGRRRVLDFYRRRPNSAIVDSTITNLNDLLNANTYPKGAWVLHMLRGVIGDEAFWAGIHEYYRRYRNKNTLTEDFRRVMEEAASRDLAWFFQQWIYQSGQPKLLGVWSYDENSKELVVEIEQQQDRLFRVPLQVGVYANGNDAPRIMSLVLTKEQNTATFKVDAAPADVVLDPDSWVLMESSFIRR